LHCFQTTALAHFFIPKSVQKMFETGSNL
jgi:hypothetical protein